MKMMKKEKTGIKAVVPIAFISTFLLVAVPSSHASSFDDYIHNHLRIGTRIVHRSFTDADSGHRGGWYGSGTFLGTIYALEEEQSYIPINLNASWLFCEHIGVEIAYDQIKAETVAWLPDRDKTDGTAQFTGLVLSGLFRYPNATQFTPYASAGIGLYSASFDYDPKWKNPSPTHSHVMECDDTAALHFAAGVEWKITDEWSIDLSAQYTQVTMDVVYFTYRNGALAHSSRSGEFPMDNIAARVGITYSF